MISTRERDKCQSQHVSGKIPIVDILTNPTLFPGYSLGKQRDSIFRSDQPIPIICEPAPEH